MLTNLLTSFPQLNNGLIMLSQFFIGFVLIVGIHELGHLLVAKACGIRVDRYNIGFPPYLLQFSWGETIYSLGLIPLGGAAHIAGMIDEPQLPDAPPLPRHRAFFAKPAWQRLAVILGGIFFNLLLGLALFAGIAYMQGDLFLSQKTLNQYGIYPTPLGKAQGLQAGDQVIAINGRSFHRWEDLFPQQESTWTYTISTPSQPKCTRQIQVQAQSALFTPLIPAIIHQVNPNSGAAQVGLQAGDQLLTLNNRNAQSLQALQAAIHCYKGEKVHLTYQRAGISQTVICQLSPKGELGVHLTSLPLTRRPYHIREAIHVSLRKIHHLITQHTQGLSQLIRGEKSLRKSFLGPIGIAHLFGSSFNGLRFWNLVASLSIILAFMNLLPIPALDGGHAVLILVELIIRRSLSSVWKNRIQFIGVALLLFFTTFVIWSDITRYTSRHTVFAKYTNK